MWIKEYTFQHRNDFSAILECEHCGLTQKLGGGYNDAFYHNKVLPSIRCNSCGKPRAAHSSTTCAPSEIVEGSQ